MCVFHPFFFCQLRGEVSARVAGALESGKGEGGIDTALDMLESLFQETRAYFGDEDKSVVQVRTEIAKVFLADANYTDALNELLEIRQPDFAQLKMILECQMKVYCVFVCVLWRGGLLTVAPPPAGRFRRRIVVRLHGNAARHERAVRQGEAGRH